MAPIRLRIELSKNRQLLIKTMILAAQKHAGMLTRAWVVAEEDEPCDALIRQAALDESHVALHLIKGSETLFVESLRWPVRSTDLFAALSKATGQLTASTGPVTSPGKPSLKPSQALDLLAQWRERRHEQPKHLVLCADGAPLLQVDMTTEWVSVHPGAPDSVGNLLRLSANSWQWKAGPESALSRPLCRYGDVIWWLAGVASEGVLLPEISDAEMRLRAWPRESLDGPSSWSAILAALRDGPKSPNELAILTGCGKRELSWFLNASLCCNYLKISAGNSRPERDRAAAIAPNRRQSESGGLRSALTAIRSALGIAA